MIYILSSIFDYSTSEVIEWIAAMGKKFKRINNMIELENDFEVQIKGINSRKSNKDSIWYRKRYYFARSGNKDIDEFYRNENKSLSQYMFYLSNYSTVIGTHFDRIVNKNEMLLHAEKYRINIPETIITNSKYKLVAFKKNHKKIIAKPISDIAATTIDSKSFGMYTKLIKPNLIASLPLRFSSTLFQEFIEKEFDIRCFYIDGNIYSMIIFSQGDKRTKIDFRNYNTIDPNRTVPYKLPLDLENNLIEFMKKEKLEASSIDLVKCKLTGKYYFLEVNPWGQFGMVSKPCNYYLEKK